MLTSIKITELQVYGYHGLFEEERSLGQRFSFDIEATLSSAPTHRNDNLAASIRYDAVVETAATLAADSKFRTLEALAEALATGLLQRFALIDNITVSVSKLSPPIPQMLAKVALTIRLTRDDLVMSGRHFDPVQVMAGAA